MKDVTPIPTPDPGFQLMEPMTGSQAAPAPKFRPQKFLFFLRKFWWMPAVGMALGAGTAIIIFFRTPPTFVSTGSLWSTEKLRLPGGATFSDDDENYIGVQSYLGTQSELIRSHMLMELTTNRLAALNPGRDIMNHLSDPVNIEVISSPQSQVYTIRATSSNPAYTPAYLNALMLQYLEYRKNIRRTVSDETLNSISEQVLKAERDLKADQETLNEYEKSNNFAVLQEESTVEGSYLVKLKTELSDYQLDYQLLAARELEGDSGTPGATNSSEIFESLRSSGAAGSSASVRMDAEQQIALLKADRERLSKYLLPKHPKMVKLDEQIAHAQKLIDVYSQQNHEQIAASRQALQIKIDSVQQFIKQWESKVADDNARLATADGLKQAIARDQGMYDRLSSLNQNVDIGSQIDQETLAILERAPTPAARSYAAGKSMLIRASIIGAGLGLGIILLMAMRDDRFVTLVEVTERFGDSVVGQVPEVRQISGAEPLALLENNDDRHMYAESYRNLRSALLYLAVDGRRPKVVIITSAVPNEGKSTIATNLARTLALGGSRVLLVDGDLRKGRIHELLKLQSKPGLSELLRQPDDPGKFIQAAELPNLAFLARGGITRNPGDLFLTPAIDQILARFREQYDYVLIDSSPVFAADDTSTLAPKADGTLFVVRSRFSHGREVREALELLFHRQARVLGLIFNRSDPSPKSNYYYKYAEYYSSANTADADQVS
jgi:capsular exopolysaccharide synthesis family protein